MVDMRLIENGTSQPVLSIITDASVMLDGSAGWGGYSRLTPSNDAPLLLGGPVPSPIKSQDAELWAIALHCEALAAVRVITEKTPVILQSDNLIALRIIYSLIGGVIAPMFPGCALIHPLVVNGDLDRRPVDLLHRSLLIAPQIYVKHVRGHQPASKRSPSARANRTCDRRAREEARQVAIARGEARLVTLDDEVRLIE